MTVSLWRTRNEGLEPYHGVQCHPERSEPASEVEGSAPRRLERLGVADPSQAQDDSQPVEDPNLTGRCAKLARRPREEGAARLLPSASYSANAEADQVQA